jgi:hypothetical protein
MNKFSENCPSMFYEFNKKVDYDLIVESFYPNNNSTFISVKSNRQTCLRCLFKKKIIYDRYIFGAKKEQKDNEDYLNEHNKLKITFIFAKILLKMLKNIEKILPRVW